MRFTVPQFIEHEPKIVGPLTFRQFITVGIGASICFILYFMVPFSIFIIACIAIGALAFAFAFLEIDGRSFSTAISNFLSFNLSNKMYLWKKKKGQIQVFQKEEKKPTEEPEKELPLKIAEKSQLKKIRTQLETKSK